MVQLLSVVNVERNLRFHPFAKILQNIALKNARINIGPTAGELNLLKNNVCAVERSFMNILVILKDENIVHIIVPIRNFLKDVVEKAINIFIIVHFGVISEDLF